MFISQVTAEDRARMAAMAAATVALSQGVAFFHAGDELLRSKSLDRDSYGSGAAPTQHSGPGIGAVAAADRNTGWLRATVSASCEADWVERTSWPAG